MDRREMLGIALAMSFPLRTTLAADAPSQIRLPSAQQDGGMPLMSALKSRRSVREFSTRPLPSQVLSNLLWAGFGVNRPESGGRTAPSAHNWQEIVIYAAMEIGLFRYDQQSHTLQGMSSEDLRARTGMQKFAGVAPLDLVYVADFRRMEGASTEDKLTYSAADTGFISQNVYLCCAQEGLVTVVRGWIDRIALSKAMGLTADQRIILAQTIGYPAV